MQPALSYHFGEIEFAVRQQIHATSARMNTSLEELRHLVAPLQQTWTRDAAEAFQAEQARWNQSAAALNDILHSLGNAVRDGADDIAATDRRAAGDWVF
ncbi:WXG100 family type VII secretion target [Mycolicibacterium phocaicum]|uniref:ESAT-6-like protein n=1 Tax=Mycolicibacterium phocaicum TaxID=319706 RepID=A0A7I7ZUN3_9MYCO|nr:WXG100 family type VII secretion target [Mycolicibacterium phocaicum]TLH63713.1 WXG100 family type VII secretion target [Mycolicibacterium phocaicum]BBZ57955.1 ESAT-6-like protein [Mycolicibacterium phocaicum]